MFRNNKSITSITSLFLSLFLIFTFTLISGLIPSKSFAAFTATTDWEVQTGGSDTNGGGFDGDSNNANNFFSDGAATVANTSAPVFTSASYNFVAGDVGHWVFIKSGTNWTTGWYKISSVAANAATLNGTIGSAVTANVSNLNVSGNPNTVVGCATTANPTAATWGIDYSQSTTPWSYTDLVIDGTTNTKITSVAHPFGKQQVGNTINITSGTGFSVQRVQITSVTGTTATCDKAVGTTSSTGGNGVFAGPLATPGTVAGLIITGNGIYIKNGSYNIANGSANTAGNKINTSVFGHWVGYATVRGDDGTPPILIATANSTTVFTSAGSARLENIECDGNSGGGLTGVVGWSITSAASICRRLVSKNANTYSFDISGGTSTLYDCYGSGASVNFYSDSSSGNVFINCVASGGTDGFLGSAATASRFFNCIALGGFSSFGFSLATNSPSSLIDHCVAYQTGNTSTGFQIQGNATICRNSIAVATGINNTGFQGNGGSANYGGWMQNNAFFGQSITTSNLNTMDSANAFITLTANPFTNAAGNDFSLNNTAGGGLLLKALGIPSSFNGLSTNHLTDVGAAQSSGVVTGGGPPCIIGE